MAKKSSLVEKQQAANSEFSNTNNNEQKKQCILPYSFFDKRYCNLTNFVYRPAVMQILTLFMHTLLYGAYLCFLAIDAQQEMHYNRPMIYTD